MLATSGLFKADGPEPRQVHWNENNLPSTKMFYSEKTWEGTSRNNKTI